VVGIVSSGDEAVERVRELPSHFERQPASRAASIGGLAPMRVLPARASRESVRRSSAGRDPLGDKRPSRMTAARPGSLTRMAFATGPLMERSRQPTGNEAGCVMRFTIASVLLILVVGILIGLALAEWLLGAVAAIGIALIVAAVALVAYLMIRRRIRVARAERGM
jgi:hypothetical protein